MRIFKHRSFHHFHQWAKSEGISDKLLKNAVDEMKNGLYDANIGSSLYKKRIALPSRDKSGGYRTLLAFRKQERAVFIYGFSKNDRDNIDKKEEKIYRQLAKDFIEMQEDIVENMIRNNKLFKVK